MDLHYIHQIVIRKFHQGVYITFTFAGKCILSALCTLAGHIEHLIMVVNSAHNQSNLHL